jgi:hypothetical protein
MSLGSAGRGVVRFKSSTALMEPAILFESFRLRQARSIFTSGVYKATAPEAAFPQEKPHFSAFPRAE